MVTPATAASPRRESLGEHRSDQPGEHVARPAGGERHDAMRVDMRGMARRRNHGLRALEHDDHAMALGVALRGADPIRLHGGGVDAGEASHLRRDAGSRRQE